MMSRNVVVFGVAVDAKVIKRETRRALSCPRSHMLNLSIISQLLMSPPTSSTNYEVSR